MIKISREEKNLIKIAGIVFTCIVLFLLLFYFPKSIALDKLKSRVEKSDALMKDLRQLIGQDTSLEQGIGILRKQAVMLSTKCVDQKDIFLSLNRLSEAADLAGVKIISLNPQSLSVLGTGVKYYEKSCLKEPARLVLRGRYEQLANYLYLLEQSPIGIFTIERFSITKEKDIAPDLKMDLTVIMYVFGEEKTVRKK